MSDFTGSYDQDDGSPDYEEYSSKVVVGPIKLSEVRYIVEEQHNTSHEGAIPRRGRSQTALYSVAPV